MAEAQCDATTRPHRGRQERGLPPSTVYTEEYFLSGACDGLDEFLHGTVSAVKRRELELLGGRPGERILDLGCGRGETSLELVRSGAQPVALDYSASAVVLTRQSLNERGVVVRGEAQALPFAADSFDRVLMGDVIEHLPWVIGLQALREIQRVLVPGGRAVIHSSPNRWFVTVVMRPLRALLRMTGRTEVVDRFNEYERLRDVMHVNELSPRSMAQMMRQAGPNAETWVDSDVIRAGASEWTAGLTESRLFRLAARGAGIWPLRLVFGNDLYARITKPDGPTSTP